MIIGVTQWALFLLCCWSMARGGWPERTCGVLLLAGFAGKYLLREMGVYLGYFHPSMPATMLTTILFSVSLAVALRSNRLWPLFFSAFFLVQLTGHLAVIVLESGVNWAYWGMTQVPIIVQTVILVIGTHAYLARARAGVRARDWL